MNAVAAARSPGNGRAVGGPEPCLDSLPPASRSLATFGLTYKGAVLREAHLEEAYLREAHLEGAILYLTYLEGAGLFGAHLEGKTYPPSDSDLARIRQWVTDFPVTLPPADLHLAFLNAATVLDDIHLGEAKGGTVRVADVRWGGVNLSVVDWTPFTDGKAMLGDEQAARDFKPEPFTESEEQRKRPRQERARARARAEHTTEQNRGQLAAFQAGVRANRQLATALRDQGMNEEADYFAYRAQVVQRQVLGRKGQSLRYLGSGLLGLIAGYGYRPLRSFVTYAVVVLGFAAAYFALGAANGKMLTWNEAIVVSMTAFHGRGFFAAVFQPGDLQAAVAAVEAFFGLLIEITFIATFT